MKKQKNIADILLPLLSITVIIIIWQTLSQTGVIPSFMLPSPGKVLVALTSDFPTLMHHARYTLLEAVIGIVISIILGFLFAVIMDEFVLVKKAIYPLLIVTQTIPTIAIAPLLVLWFGFGLLPKVLLIIIVCFFPVAVGFLDGFSEADEDEIRLLRSMGANKYQIFRHVKFKRSLPHFFAALKISCSYCIVSAVISEWLGGTNGLGVYMTRVRKSYSFDKMFAVIIIVSVLSILLMYAVSLIQRLSMPYKHRKEK